MLLPEKKAVSAVTALFLGKVMMYLRFLPIFVLVTILNYNTSENQIESELSYFGFFKLKNHCDFFELPNTVKREIFSRIK